MTHPGPPPYPQDALVGEPTPDERSLAVLAHLSTIAGLVLSVGWLSFVGPLVLWLVVKDRSRFVRASAAGAFNVNVSLWLLTVVGWIMVLTVVLAWLGLPLVLFSGLVQVILHVVGAVRANRGEVYRYPLQFVTILH